MPVYKFRSFEELERFEREGRGIRWNFGPDRRHWDQAGEFLLPRRYPPGVYRFRSFEEAQDWTLKWQVRG